MPHGIAHRAGMPIVPNFHLSGFLASCAHKCCFGHKQGYAKGYLVHGSKTAVMAKGAAFPMVYLVVVKTETYYSELGAAF